MKRAKPVFLFFLAACCCSMASVASDGGSNAVESVRVTRSENGAWELTIGGRPYFIKGMLYNPAKVGESPSDATLRDWTQVDDDGDGANDFAFQSWVDEDGDGRRGPAEKPVGDFALLKEAGVNTIRLYHVASDNPLLGDVYKVNRSVQVQYDHAPNKALFRKLYRDYGIRVIMGNFLGSWTIGAGTSWEEGTDYKNPVHRENIKKSVRAMVLDHKDEPYVLFWLLGNENNIATWSRCNAKTEPEAYASLVGELARMVKELDPNHPVAVSDGDAMGLNYLSNYAKHAPEIDIVGLNSYRGPRGFDFMWKQAQRAFDRPIVVTEFGIFAYNTIRGEDEDQQLVYLRGCWKDIVMNGAENADGKKRMGNALGGVVFDWTDRWYMDGSPSEHNAGTKAWQFSPDKKDHEEWFGVMSMGDGSDSLLRKKRKTYEYLKDAWNRDGLSY